MTIIPASEVVCTGSSVLWRLLLLALRPATSWVTAGTTGPRSASHFTHESCCLLEQPFASWQDNKLRYQVVLLGHRTMLNLSTGSHRS